MSEVDKLLDILYNKNKTLQELRESRAPEIGIFYVVDGEIFISSEPTRLILDIRGGVKCTSRTHSEYWADIQTLRPEFKKVKPFDYPRGRVIYIVEKDRYEMIADEKIVDNKPLVNKIASMMNIPKSKLGTLTDWHYQSNK